MILMIVRRKKSLAYSLIMHPMNIAINGIGTERLKKELRNLSWQITWMKGLIQFMQLIENVQISQMTWILFTFPNYQISQKLLQQALMFGILRVQTKALYNTNGIMRMKLSQEPMITFMLPITSWEPTMSK